MGFTRLRIEHNTDHDVYVVYSSVAIATVADCEEYLQVHVEAFAPIGKPIDVIFVPEHFEVDPAISATWSRYIFEMFGRFIRFKIRLVGDLDFSIANATSAIKRNEEVPTAPDTDTALVLIAHMRARAGV